MNFKGERVKLDLCSLLHLYIKRSQKRFFFNPVKFFLLLIHIAIRLCSYFCHVSLFEDTMSICISFEKKIYRST